MAWIPSHLWHCSFLGCHREWEISHSCLAHRGYKRSFRKQNIDDYTRMLQRHAAGLLTMANPGIIPPGHPLYNRQNSVETLQAENSKLQRENLELKKQLESAPRGKRML